ncbi:YbhN family protein [Streptomyces adustus]|uniref:lysylphosphatidylglycerol synthase transmembrane domain-containing protein n=1 Tax=Streptomyces adustus TaxID=1609272 RepID=UPI0035DBBAE2
MRNARERDADTRRVPGTRADVASEHARQPDASRSVALPHSRRRVALIAAAVVTVLGAESVAIAPHAHRAAGQLARAEVRWLVPALACEMVSMMMFARLQRHALSPGGLRVRLGSAAATVFAGSAVGATLPGGSLVAITYRTRRMRSWGASASQIGFAHAATGALSTIALALLAGLGHVLAGDGARLVSVAVQIGAICALTGAALALVHRPATLRRPVRALVRMMHRLRRDTAVQASADRLLDELAAMRPPPRFWGRGLALALFNWGADAACLLAACHAVGARPGVSTVLFAYAAAMAAASAMPLLPAGIGTLDAALVLTLHHGGVPLTAATAADLLYRMITPGLVGIAGWILLLQQRRRAARTRHGHDVVHGAGDVPAIPGTIAGPHGAARKT